jgi:hypothetical protein
MGSASQSGWYTSLIKPKSNNLAISLFSTSFLSWVKWRSHCLMGLAFGSRCSSCSINSLGTPDMSAGFHAKMSLFSWRNLTSKFLFGIQTIAHVSHLGRFLSGQRDCLTECVLWLDGCLGSLGLGHGWVWLGLDQGIVQLLELFGCQQSITSLTTLPVTAKSSLDVSPDGDDTTWPWHLQDQVSII